MSYKLSSSPEEIIQQSYISNPRNQDYDRKLKYCPYLAQYIYCYHWAVIKKKNLTFFLLK